MRVAYREDVEQSCLRHEASVGGRLRGLLEAGLRGVARCGVCQRRNEREARFGGERTMARRWSR